MKTSLIQKNFNKPIFYCYMQRGKTMFAKSFCLKNSRQDRIKHKMNKKLLDEYNVTLYHGLTIQLIS